MNTETGIIKPTDEITGQEWATGHWIRIPKEYERKMPLTDADKAAVLRAEAKRLRKCAARLTTPTTEIATDAE